MTPAGSMICHVAAHKTVVVLQSEQSKVKKFYPKFSSPGFYPGQGGSEREPVPPGINIFPPLN